MPMFDLRSRCSRYFTFGDLIECGETWSTFDRNGAPISNVPARAETFDGVASLAQKILDPLHEEFGPVLLTYGFAGPLLTKHIKGRISPPHDQHAGSELDSRGQLISVRRGQSCDLRVPDKSAFEIARWIRESLPFDRLYLYGAKNALHVSYGPERAGKVYAMVNAEKRRIPRDVTRSDWEAIARMLGDE